MWNEISNEPAKGRKIYKLNIAGISAFLSVGDNNCWLLCSELGLAEVLCKELGIAQQVSLELIKAHLINKITTYKHALETIEG